MTVPGTGKGFRIDVVFQSRSIVSLSLKSCRQSDEQASEVLLNGFRV